MPRSEAIRTVVDLVLLLACRPAKVWWAHTLKFVVQVVTHSAVSARVGIAVVVRVMQLAPLPSEARRACAHGRVEQH